MFEFIMFILTAFAYSFIAIVGWYVLTILCVLLDQFFETEDFTKTLSKTVEVIGYGIMYVFRSIALLILAPFLLYEILKTNGTTFKKKDEK